MVKFDVVIKNGTIIDGTGVPGYQSDIGIIKDTIVHIGKIRDAEGNTLIEATGKVVCPGFIDMHCHSDLYILEQPYLSAKIRQGITTELLGQDGIAAAPLPEQYKEEWRSNLAGLDGQPNIQWDWNNVESYLHKIERTGPFHNVAFLVPHGNVRMTAMGLAGRIATDEEIDLMKQILRESLNQGACGISSGLIYPPCVFADKRELTAICEVAAEYGVPFIVHQRSEGDEILESMDELLTIAKATKVHLHFSHFKVCGERNWYKTTSVLGALDKAREEGLVVTFDQYPYTAGSTMLSAILPPWVHEGGTSSMLDRLKNSQFRKQIIEEMHNGLKGWDSIAAWAGWKGIFVTSTVTDKNKMYIGKHIEEIARLENVSDPAEMALQLILEEENAVGMIDFVMEESSIIQIMNHPAGTICTDGLLGGEPHPRAYGAFPRVLSNYVRDRQALPLEKAIQRMTSLPASIIGFTDRGIIRVGQKADLVIFDKDKIRDTATYEQPRQYPEGIAIVMVNGQIVVDEAEKENHVAAGKVLRRTYY